MTSPVESRPDHVDREVGRADAAAATRRRLLRMVAGGAPLLAGPDAIASVLPMSSAARAARNDAKEWPQLVSARADRWIRQPVDIVLITEKRKRSSSSSDDDESVAPLAADPGSLALGSLEANGLRFGRKTFLAYCVRAHGASRYFRCDDFASFVPTAEHDVIKTPAQVWMLVLFDRQSFQMLPELVDPQAYRTGKWQYQGLRCSSWASINPNGGRPLSCGV